MNDLITPLFLLFTGFLTGFALSVFFYPKWEVSKIYRTFIKEGKKYGEWKHFTDRADHSLKVIVKPNCETLYSSTFVDLSQEIYEICIPETKDYFSLAILASNTDVKGYVTNVDLKKNGTSVFRIAAEKDSGDFILPKGKYWLIARFGISHPDKLDEVTERQKKLILRKV